MSRNLHDITDRMGGKYDVTMLRTAALWAEHGTCSRLQVGCVIARDERIISQGYNGAPMGMTHCDHECNCSGMMQDPGQEHLDLCNSGPEGCQAVHAEQNAIVWAARIGSALAGSTLYCTHQPCLICARLILMAGIVTVFYNQPYRDRSGLDLLNRSSVITIQLTYPR